MSTDNKNGGCPDVKIVTIMRFYDINEAEMAAGMLEAEGVKCGLVGANLYNINYFYGLASGGIRLEVRQSDAIKAIELLRQTFSPRQIPDDTAGLLDDTSENDDKCPRCGSENITFEKYARRSFFLGILLFGFPLPIKKNRYHCLSCGWCWK